MPCLQGPKTTTGALTFALEPVRIHQICARIGVDCGTPVQGHAPRTSNTHLSEFNATSLWSLQVLGISSSLETIPVVPHGAVAEVSRIGNL